MTDTPLARILKHCGLTQQALGDKVGLPQGHVSKLVTGRAGVTRDMARRLVDALQPARIDFDELALLYPERFPGWVPGAKPLNPIDGKRKRGATRTKRPGAGVRV